MNRTVAVCAALVVAGCASQPISPEARAEWETCADGHVVVGWTMNSMFGGDVFSTEALARATAEAMNQECGTGGLSREDRAAHILAAMLAINEDPAAFIKDYEARSDAAETE